MRLKNFPLEIIASAGAATIDQCSEAFGAFLMQQAGMPTGCEALWDIDEELFRFAYKGRVWRLCFIMIHDRQLGKTIPFRIDFDYTGETDNGTRETRLDGADSVQRGSVH